MTQELESIFFEITLELNNTINWEFFPFVMSETNLYSAESLNCSLVCCWIFTLFIIFHLHSQKKANHLTLPQDCKSLIFYSTRCLLISQFHLTKSERAECQQLLQPSFTFFDSSLEGLTKCSGCNGRPLLCQRAHTAESFCCVRVSAHIGSHPKPFKVINNLSIVFCRVWLVH